MSGHQQRKIHNDLPRRHIFADQVDIVPRGDLYLKRIVSRSGARTACMLYYRLWRIAVFVAGQLCPPADIHILQIGEVPHIKSSQLLQQIPAIDRRPATCTEDPVTLIIVAGRLVLGRSIGPAQRTVVIPGIVHHRGILHGEHCRCHGKSILFLPDLPIQRFHKARFRFRIVIEQYHIFAACVFDPVIDRCTETAVF